MPLASITAIKKQGLLERRQHLMGDVNILSITVAFLQHDEYPCLTFLLEFGYPPVSEQRSLRIRPPCNDALSRLEKKGATWDFHFKVRINWRVSATQAMFCSIVTHGCLA